MSFIIAIISIVSVYNAMLRSGLGETLKSKSNEDNMKFENVQIIKTPDIPNKTPEYAKPTDNSKNK
jgi:hypothetical protein